eukprot:15477097-Alexandrium_andersonii.AAC.1
MKFLAGLGISSFGKAKGLNREFNDAFARLTGDPDQDLSERVRSGAPLVVARPAASRGVFPK